MADFIKGDVIILYVHDGSAFEPIACLTSNSLSQTRNIIEAQTKCDPGEIIKGAGSQTYEITFEGNYIDTTSAGSPDLTSASHDKLLGYFGAGTAVTWKMDTGLTDTVAYYGTAIISDLSMDAPAGDEFVTFSGTLNGSGVVSTTDPTV